MIDLSSSFILFSRDDFFGGKVRNFFLEDHWSGGENDFDAQKRVQVNAVRYDESSTSLRSTILR